MFDIDQESVMVYQEAVVVKKHHHVVTHQRESSSKCSSVTMTSSSTSSTGGALPTSGLGPSVTSTGNAFPHHLHHPSAAQQSFRVTPPRFRGPLDPHHHFRQAHLAPASPLTTAGRCGPPHSNVAAGHNNGWSSTLTRSTTTTSAVGGATVASTHFQHQQQTSYTPYSQQLYKLKVTYSSAPPKQQAYDRTTCGPQGQPPPLKQAKSPDGLPGQNLCDVRSAPNGGVALSLAVHHQQQQQQLLNHQRPRQRAVGAGNAVCRRFPCRTADDIIKGTRVPLGYELSQDLLDKQVEVLERKYGGQVKAGHAALTIQRAFRRYAMVKKFRDITSTKSEKRLSRRFNGTVVDPASSPCSGSGSLTPAGQTGGPRGSAATSPTSPQERNGNVRNHYAALCRELNETLEPSENGAGRPPRPVRSLSLREKRPTPLLLSGSSASTSSSASSECSQRGSGTSRHHRRSEEHHSATSTSVHHQHSNSESDFSDAGGGVDDGVSATYCGAASPPAAFRHILSSRQNGSGSFHQQVVHVDSLTSPYSPTDVPPGMCLDPRCDRLFEQVVPSGNNANNRRLGGGGMCARTAAALAAVEASTRRNSAPPGGGESGSKSRRAPPPEVPKRTSSISVRNLDGSGKNGGDLLRSPDGGSLSSVQSSGSESSLTGSGSDRATPAGKILDDSFCKASDVNTGSMTSHEHYHPLPLPEDKRLSNISENSEDSFEGTGYSSSPPVSDGAFRHPMMHTPCGTPLPGPLGYYKVTEVVRKRQYRVGLNLFNKKPEKGVFYLIQRAFLENSPQGVARFLISRKGLSKQMIGEYLGNLQNNFNMEVLECFAVEIDLAGMQVDVALRKFQTYFRMPGEAQKIERLVEVFSSRYCECNRDIVSRFRNADTIFILAFAIIMLNTDLHTPNMKPEKRMKPEDFVKNVRGIDDGGDIEAGMLLGIYERIKANEFRPGSDHVTQVMKVQQTIVGKKPTLALPHRRLVCYCRLYEVNDVNKKERQGLHQREVFLFNDLLVVTKILSKKKNGVTYTFRMSFPLCGLQVSLFQVPHYPHGIRLQQKVDGKVAIVFNARNEHDRTKFVEDLKESILEMDEMENLRIECELEKQKMARTRTTENRDSGVADMELPSSSGSNGAPPGGGDGSSSSKTSSDSGIQMNGVVTNGLKRSALSNSLLDIHEQSEKPQRRGSAGSLDSGMSVSFQSSVASLGSRDSSPHQANSSSSGKLTGGCVNGGVKLQNSGSSASSLSTNQSFLGSLFGKKGKGAPKGGAAITAANGAVKVCNATSDATEV